MSCLEQVFTTSVCSATSKYPDLYGLLSAEKWNLRNVSKVTDCKGPERGSILFDPVMLEYVILEGFPCFAGWSHLYMGLDRQYNIVLLFAYSFCWSLAIHATLNLLLAFRRVIFLTSGSRAVSSTHRTVMMRYLPQCGHTSSRSGAWISRQSFALKFFVEGLLEKNPTNP